MKTTIIVATHKACEINSDPVYLPIHAGAALHGELPYTGDDTGDSISEKNATFCELTALYWAWKHLDGDYLGLCHYRRYFGSDRKHILTGREAEALLAKYPILLPKPRNYVIETNYSQYIHSHHEIDLTLTREILAQQDASNGTAFAPAFDRVMARTVGHRFNMFVMRRDLLDAYCNWLFPILFTLEERLDISAYSPYDSRVFGFVGERLLDVWLDATGQEYKELPYIFIGSENWPMKILNFLKRKFTH